ncbi:MAG: hypothetical protein CL613_02935 [Aquimarina sp.]|nr:hypothetical protein [Aquimarina sp.]
MRKLFFTFLILYSVQTYYSYGQEQTLYLQPKGKDSISTKLIEQSTLNSKFKDFSSLQKSILKTQQLLINKGYIFTEYDKPIKINDSTFSVNYSLNQKIDSIQLFFNPNTIQPSLILKDITIKENYFIIPYSKTGEILDHINKHYTAIGDTFNWVRLSNIKNEENILLADLIISNKKEKRKIDHINIIGYNKFPRSFLKYFLKIKEGKVFSKEDLIKKESKIKNLSFASSLKPPEVLFKKDSTSVFLYLQKGNNNNFDGFLGFSNNEGSSKISFNGYINLILNNNLNYGEKLNIVYKNDGREQQRFEASLLLPYLFGSPVGLEGKLEIFKQDSTFINTKQIIGLQMYTGRNFDISVGYQFVNSTTLTEQTSSDITNYKTNAIISSFSYNSTLSHETFTEPKSYLSLNLLYGKRKTEDNDLDQINSTFFASHIFKLNPSNFVYLSNETSALLSENYFINELFRTGGINSIRGFNENSIFTSFHTILSTEYRYILSNNLYAHSIIDYGYIQNEISNSTDNLSSIGIGLGLKSKAGIFKLIFANGRTKNQSFKLTNTRVHISMSSNF